MRRTPFCNGFGIATAEEDTDATDVKKEPDAKSPRSRIIFLLRRLGVTTKDPKQIREQVQKLTQLESVEKNYPDIVSRLEVIVQEREEYEKNNVQ